jgi:hypothetical protein
VSGSVVGRWVVGDTLGKVPGPLPVVVRAYQPTLLKALCRPTLAPDPRAGPHPRPRPRPRRVRTLKAVTVGHFGFPTPRRSCRSPARPATCTPPDGGGPSRSMRSPAWASPRPAPPGSPTTCAGTGRSRRSTTSATSPSPRTAPSFALALAQRHGLPGATSPSVCSAARGPSTSPPRCATTPATPPSPWLPSASPREQPHMNKHHQKRRSPGSPPDPASSG